MTCEDCRGLTGLEIMKAREEEHKNGYQTCANDIARDLWACFDDFMDSIDDPMDEELGEIYREKLKGIFKALEKRGVDFEKMRRG